MNRWKATRTLATLSKLAALSLVASLATSPARAHCDTLDGPVVNDARTALSRGDAAPVLKWVRPRDEAEIRAAFQKAVRVRAGGEDARDLADTYFFETLVRVHRAGEGAPYTGLKPAGQPVEAGIRATDHALAEGDGAGLAREVAEAVTAGIKERFDHAAEARKHAGENVSAGREYVAAYVSLMHYVEGIHQAASGPAHHGTQAAAKSEPHAGEADKH